MSRVLIWTLLALLNLGGLFALVASLATGQGGWGSTLLGLIVFNLLGAYLLRLGRGPGH
ncbi:hypothetical protein HNR42_000437 [Deinobacterium chartae]|uniref:Uncharacterized protein n=1 Tax=Deinobacterium chartae TaxID=521158 RepID=A0A841HW15_9DEIO|nr:hypothetical protein [Deinobacterium chartae]MBB6097023.1 hypothetical protein [Deinobacterium chartae]